VLAGTAVIATWRLWRRFFCYPLNNLIGIGLMSLRRLLVLQMMLSGLVVIGVRREL